MRVFLLVLICALFGCEQLPGDESPRGEHRLRAFTFADWSSEGYAQPAVLAELDRVAALGATHIVVLITAYQATALSPGLRSVDGRTPRESAVRTIVGAIQARGLVAAIKLHVDVDDGAWRARIRPQEEAPWFDSYLVFARRWARVAESVGVEMFILGTELAGTLEFEAEWDGVISAMRDDFSGALLYAASWDEADDVPFWTSLDYVGVNFYYPLTERQDPDRFELLAAWQYWLPRLASLQRRAGRPLLLTELGYRSVRGAGAAPFEFDDAAPLDLQAQADLYWAALEATAGHEWLDGIVWWNWLATGDGGPLDRDFTPRGKPAEDIVRGAWGAP
jgi:hypothetical protein